MAHYMAAGNTLDMLCLSRISPHVREMEQSHSEKVCNRLWKLVRDDPTYGSEEVLEVALVYKYVTKKQPESFLLMSQKLKQGKYDPSSVKKCFKQQDGLKAISNYIRSLDKEGKMVLACMLIQSSSVLSRTVLVELVGGISEKNTCDILPVQTADINLFDSDSEEETRDAWLEEVTKQINTLTPVLQGKFSNPEEKELCQLIKTRIEDFVKLERMAKEAGSPYDKRTYMRSLLKELCSILQGDKVLKAKGLVYQILVGVGEQLYQLLKSVE
ncbi:matrix protein [Thailand tick thogotovirus]|uniref:Matrix protein n=1 Tax=Thailand tick thogotovirus TaxID=2654565 RepID=A0A5P8N5U5_9ORTO|nr:matrix protein [Thailand tick thogotovirus]QFR36193.1 matrix protein [Thailand tick thogotovirus]